jgi:hypothetical protein
MRTIWKVGIGVFLAAVAAIGLEAFQKQQLRPRPVVSEQDAALATDLVRDGELVAAARIVHRVLDRVPVSKIGVASFDELAARSTDILIGTVGTGFGHLVPGARHVTTEYEFSINEVFKGTRVGGALSILSVVGGRVVLDDGGWIETRPEGLEPLMPGDRILLFAAAAKHPVDPRVRERAKPHPVVSPVTYAGGMLLIGSDGSVMPRPEYALASLIRPFVGKKVDEVIREIREAVKNEDR